MTITPDAAGPDGAGWEIPADDAADEEVDVLYLAGQCPPEEGAWLWVATDARRGGEFTALFLPRIRPRASGGDVLLRIAPGRGEGDVEQWPVPSVRVRVWAVAAGSLILVAGWTGWIWMAGPSGSAPRPCSPRGCCGNCKSTALMSGRVTRSRWRRQRSRQRPGSLACRPG